MFETATTKLSSEYHEIGRFESAQDPDYLKVIDKLLEFTNARQLMDAAKENDLERIEALLEKKDGVSIDVDYQNVLGRTALHVSVRGNSDDVVAWRTYYCSLPPRISRTAELYIRTWSIFLSR